MKKNIYTFLGIICSLLILFSSCSKSESAQERLRKQKRAIETYMDRNGLVVLSKFPSDSIFKANEYYKTNEGLYINIVYKGNGNKPVLGRTISVRFDYCFDVQTFVEGDEADATYTPHELFLPFTFTYGVSGSYTGYACDGWVYPLSYVTEGAVVNLIVPSKLSNSTDQSYYRAEFFKNLEYTSFDLKQ